MGDHLCACENRFFAIRTYGFITLPDLFSIPSSVSLGTRSKFSKSVVTI